MKDKLIHMRDKLNDISRRNRSIRLLKLQRFLECRGWTIERIWSRNWWKNSTAEIEKIDQLVKELLRRESVLEYVVK
jgi:very-short-patch-repair endonuclease